MSSIALENESEEAIDRFAETAREFCSWLEGEPSDDMSERFTKAEGRGKAGSVLYFIAFGE